MYILESNQDKIIGLINVHRYHLAIAHHFTVDSEKSKKWNSFDLWSLFNNNGYLSDRMKSRSNIIMCVKWYI